MIYNHSKSLKIVNAIRKYFFINNRFYTSSYGRGRKLTLAIIPKTSYDNHQKLK